MRMDITAPVRIEAECARAIREVIEDCASQWDCSTEKADLGGALFEIALDHHEAICALSVASAYASSFALARPMIETCCRKAWVDLIATPEDVLKVFRNEANLPSLGKLVGQLEKACTGKQLSQIFIRIQPHLGRLNGQTHSGTEQILRRLRLRNSGDAGFGLMEIVENLRSATAGLVLAAHESCTVEQRNRIWGEVLREHSWLATTVADKP
jgi:hypothetical protein